MEKAPTLRRGAFERITRALNWIVLRHGRAARLPRHLLTGLAGEDAAFFHLQRGGYRIVARRWGCRDIRGDVDLIAWDGPMLCFIEVKTRTAHTLTPAEAAVDEAKRRILRRLARRYLRQLPGPAAPPLRFDVVSVYLVPGKPEEVTHFQAAFAL